MKATPLLVPAIRFSAGELLLVRSGVTETTFAWLGVVRVKLLNPSTSARSTLVVKRSFPSSANTPLRAVVPSGLNVPTLEPAALTTRLSPEAVDSVPALKVNLPPGTGSPNPELTVSRSSPSPVLTVKFWRPAATSPGRLMVTVSSGLVASLVLVSIVKLVIP